MFDAYSFSLDDAINISQVKNPNEQFGCLNKNCSAIFIPKALNSSVAKHFCRLRTTPHTDGCLYMLESSKYHHTKLLDKFSIYDILNTNSNNNNGSRNNTRNNNKNREEHRTTNNVHTPKQLLAFCVSNSIDTVYIDNIMVGDIIIDSRNLKQNALFRGTNGIRLILGTTLKYDFSDNSITFKVTAPTKNNSSVTLTAVVYAEREIIELVVNYILDKYNKKFKSHHIAVMGDWEKIKDYTMKTTITNDSQIIFRF